MSRQAGFLPTDQEATVSRPRETGASENDYRTRYERLQGSKELPDIVGCRERIELVFWYDRRTRKVAIVGEQVDEWTTPGVMRCMRWWSSDAGPFTAREDAADALAEFATRVLREFDMQ